MNETEIEKEILGNCMDARILAHRGDDEGAFSHQTIASTLFVQNIANGNIQLLSHVKWLAGEIASITKLKFNRYTS
jgi:hypothetical protein